MQLHDDVRNAMIAAYAAAIGPSPTLELRTGAPPPSVASADSGTLIVAIAVPSIWLTEPSVGTVALAGAWIAEAEAAGSPAGHYRLKDSGGVVREQGTVTSTGGGGDCEVNILTPAVGQIVSVTAWTRTQAGA